MADSYSAVGTNALKLVGDGASGIGPYTKFGTVVLTAIKVTSTTTNFTTTPEAANSNLYKAVKALQMGAEVFYVGKPTSSGSNNFVALVNSATLQRGGRGASAYGGTDDTGDTTFEALEEIITNALGQSANDTTIAEVVLTGPTFA
jgi:hypothetical protein